MASRTTKSPRVVDFSTHLSGPVASRQLVHLGADVVKVENPRFGDGNRTTTPLVDGVGMYHLVLNPGTRSITADVRSPGWPRLTARLAAWADVVIVGNRPSAAARYGIDFHSIVKHRADVVYCLITGYGLDGPWSGLPAHGLNMDAYAGLVPVEWADGRPVPSEAYRSAGTTLAGIHAALGIYAGLHRRSLDGQAQFVHVSIWESAIASMWRDIGTYANTGELWPGYRDKGSRYCMYGTADDRAILLCPGEKHFWESFCDVVELPAALRARGDWSSGMDFGEDYLELGEREEIQERIGRRPLDDWVRLMAAADIPFAPVLDWREVLGSEHGSVNGLVSTYEHDGHTVEIPSSPVSVTSADGATTADDLAAAHRVKGAVPGPPPELGADTESVLEELGVPDLAEDLLAP
ncbi:MAG TPA: CaiB/BaiF CoA-transferase family protein [Acidimicrobiales bacterium]|nr:CaiB/BaiF CoA-transferase family protein [Acidimicrobiales bacterium]